jgi:hypothetical protein
MNANNAPDTTDTTLVIAGNARRAEMLFECPGYVVALINGREITLMRGSVERIIRDHKRR